MALGYLTFANAPSRCLCYCHRLPCGANGAWHRPSLAKTKATVGGRFLITNHWRFPQRRRGKMLGKIRKRNYIPCSIAPLFCCCFLFGLSGSTIMQNTVILGADRRIYLSLFWLGLAALNKALPKKGGDGGLRVGKCGASVL